MLYFDNIKREIRLYILIKTLNQEVFKLIYNKIKYLDYTYIYKKLIRNIYIFNISIKLYKYLRHYSYYQLYQISRYKSYESLWPIYTLSRLFYIIIIDFILTLLKTFFDYNFIISIIEKINKTITLILKSSN